MALRSSEFNGSDRRGINASSSYALNAVRFYGGIRLEVGGVGGDVAGGCGIEDEWIGVRSCS